WVFGAADPRALVPAGAAVPVRILFRVDAAGAAMLLTAAVASLAAGIASLRSEDGATGRASYHALFLLLVAAVNGMCATGDAFNLFVFLEITTLAGAAVAAYRIDNGLAAEAGLKYAAIGSLGGLAFLLGVGLLLAQHDALNIGALAAGFAANGLTPLDKTAFVLMAAPLAMKCGAVPMHHWTPDLYARAPASGSPLLIVSSQASLFGLFRVCFSLFGAAAGSPVRVMGWAVVAMAVASMFIGVTMALAQHDVKRLIAHHGVSQTGYMLLGAGVCLAVLGKPGAIGDYGRDALAGSLFHVMNYAVYNGLLFLAAAAVIARTGRRDLDAMGGLGRQMPVTMVCFGIGALAIAGIPPMSGFASKWVLYETVFRFSPLLSVVAMVVSLLTLASFVKVFQAMFLGPPMKAWAGVREVPALWLFSMVALAILTVLMGLFPDFLMDRLLRPAADALVSARDYLPAALVGGAP
ncbi:MAG: NADH:ubiquinone oxidoreductase, partial [Kiritimatiellae bacterium]|nr:NADH:ubiquinone oxidoreductase [Kiritimatiellia bacterium]